jgi:superfamily II DNA or RNA helicase
MHLDLDALNEKRLRSYAADLGLLREHYGIEETVLAGGYGYRQILELVQNGADAILEAQESGIPPTGGNRIDMLLRGSRLYVANTGAPLSPEGMDALLRSHSSPKRGNQIGRFGLGFKSLLRLMGRIDLFTRASGAIRFDPHRCRNELKQQFNVGDAPALRLAWSLDESERETDNTCSELAWAETIVRVEVGAQEALEHLRQEIRAFPAEFLLFFPVPTVLVVDDGEQPPRHLNVEPEGEHLMLHDGAEKSRWRVARRDVHISEARALADATHIHARESVPLAWAVPLEGRREEAGRFWAFFPTHTQTFVPGILNAPWKLNSDRNAIIGGEWNTALMVEAADLVAKTLPSLSSPDDPARPLDAFPRQLERKDEDATPLVEALWKALETCAVVPDAAGTLRLGRDLWRHPRDTAELARRWQALADPVAAREFVHPSCLERQRNSRLNVLAERLAAPEGEVAPGLLQRREAAAWFETIASNEGPKAAAVLHFAEVYADDCKPGEWSTVRAKLRIIPSETGELLTASQAVLAPEGTSVPGRSIVTSALYDDAGTRRILADVMKVQPLDASLWEQMLRESLQPIQSIPRYQREAVDAAWKGFWARLRQAPAEVRNQFAQRHREQIRMRRRDGTWVMADEVLLPGSLIKADELSANRNVLVDEALHGPDGAALSAIGVRETPEGDTGPASYGSIVRDGDVLAEWLSACRSKYKQTHENSASWSYLQPISLTMPKGFGLLPELSGGPNARLTDHYLKRLSRGTYSEDIRFGHSTMSVYPKMDVPHPLPWLLKRHGSVEIGGTTVQLAAVLARRHVRCLSTLPAWAAALAEYDAALTKLQQAFPVVQPTTDDIRTMWLALIEASVTPAALAEDELTDLWGAAAEDGVVPEALPSSQGAVPLAAVFVINSPDLARRARSPERIVVALDKSTLDLWVGKGARDLSELLEPTWEHSDGPADLLTSAQPELTEVLRPEIRETALCQPVSGLELKLDDKAEPVPCLMWRGTLLMDTKQLASRSRAERLRLLVEEIAPAGWLDRSTTEVLKRLGDAKVDALRAGVAQGTGLADKLLRAVGGRRDPLLEALGALRHMDFVQQCAPSQLADLVLAQLGPATLTALRETLYAEGLNPPRRWNTSEARAFVASIGFPAEFASAPDSKREAEESISGPIELPPLHDFQQEVMQGIAELLGSGTQRRRAVVSLPTGGGKTRVTVEAVVRLLLAPKRDRRCVVWVAQTDELCEQAVQAFRQVWVNLGAQRTDLRIVRLWGGNPNPAVQRLDRPIVVVASIQTLNSRMGSEGLAWLQQPGMVVVDECHHAITPSYTNLLRWLDAEAPRPGATARDEPPILGLSATPFRTDDEESTRLARRFDSRWLPADQEHLHVRLRDQGVLANVESEALDSGVDLLPEEIERLSMLPEPWEGIEFENLLEAINQRLGGNQERNERLVNRIKAATERSVLFFANSVAHAEEMSARLNLQGLSAAAVSGNTPMAARRYFLERFQEGDIRILCNHSVLTTGFDAPKTDMVLVSRAVFSPVRYMQMVGRGLRGEKNGGTASCRIVTVVDNLGRYRDRHPYHYCQRYFEESVAH